ncbi:restriction endonuclease subunit S [Kingella pumchi]
MKDLPIPLPPLSEQQAIVEKLNRLLAEIDALENA